MTAQPDNAALAARRQHFLLRSVNKAIRDYQMIADGDRIAVAVSGGKDSLTLLRLLQARLAVVPQRYELVAVHVTNDAATCGGPVDHAPLLAYLDMQGTAYALTELEPPNGTARRAKQGPCFHCAWRRRKAIFQAASRVGCNVVAFGHHADDLAETTLLNLFFQGRIETIEPKRVFFGGKLTVIRPLAYIPEKSIVRFASVAGFPPPPPPCAGLDRSRRELMRAILMQAQAVYPKARINVVRASLRPRELVDRAIQEQDTTEEELS